jgi:hypothetical protein
LAGRSRSAPVFRIRAMMTMSAMAAIPKESSTTRLSSLGTAG